MKMNIHTNKPAYLVSLAIVFCLLWIPAYAERKLNVFDVNALFSGKTIHSYHEQKKFDIILYFAPKGTFRGIRNGKKSSGKWWVNDKGEICVKRVAISRCRVVIEHNGTYKKYKLKNEKDLILMETLTAIEDGNPKKF